MGSSNWGGARPGAGRKPKGERALVSHKTRPALSGRTALHVVLRFVSRVDLSKPRIRRVIDESLQQARDRLGFHVVEIRSGAEQLHLLAEADDREAMSRGMQGLSIRIARGINRVSGWSGDVFADHYEAFVLRSRDAVARARNEAAPVRVSADAVSPPRLAVLRRQARHPTKI